LFDQNIIPIFSLFWENGIIIDPTYQNHNLIQKLMYLFEKSLLIVNPKLDLCHSGMDHLAHGLLTYSCLC